MKKEKKVEVEKISEVIKPNEVSKPIEFTVPENIEIKQQPIVFTVDECKVLLSAIYLIKTSIADPLQRKVYILNDKLNRMLKMLI